MEWLQSEIYACNLTSILRTEFAYFKLISCESASSVFLVYFIIPGVFIQEYTAIPERLKLSLDAAILSAASTTHLSPHV